MDTEPSARRLSSWIGARTPRGHSLPGAVAMGVCSVVACSSPPGGSASVKGMLGGAPIATADVIGVKLTSGTGAQAVTSVSISIASVGGSCGALQRGVSPGNLRDLAIGVTAQASSIETGTYTIGQGSASTTADYRVTDINCMGPLDLATGGSVTFTAISSDVIQGKFDLTFADGHVTGDFYAPVCSANAGQTTCGH